MPVGNCQSIKDSQTEDFPDDHRPAIRFSGRYVYNLIHIVILFHNEVSLAHLIQILFVLVKEVLMNYGMYSTLLSHLVQQTFCLRGN